MALTGPKTRQQLDQNLTALEQGPLSGPEDEWVREFGRRVRAQKRFVYF